MKDREATAEEREYYAFSAKVYAKFAYVYDAVTLPLRKLRREVVAAAGVSGSARVLDVATGTGAQARTFAANGREVVGVDLSDAMLRVARRKNRWSNLSFQKADATDLPFPDAAFDLACISFALHEMPATVRAATLSEMARVTRPGGTVLVVDYALPRRALGRWLVYHAVKLYERDLYAKFMQSDLRAQLAAAGVDVQMERLTLHGVARIVVGTRRATDQAAIGGRS